MSAVEELLLAVRQKDENDASAEGQSSLRPGPPRSRLPKINRRCLLKFSIVAICLGSFFAGGWLSLSLFFRRRLSRADISLEDATIYISGNNGISDKHRLQLAVWMPKSSLAMPVASYSLRVTDAKVKVGVGTDNGRPVGIVTLANDLWVHSWHDVDTRIDGDFSISDNNAAADALWKFAHLSTVPLWSKISCRVQVKLWNFLPLEFSLASALSPASVAGLDLVDRPIKFTKSSGAEGQPQSLILSGKASVFNPSKFHLIIAEPLQMRASYNSTTIGSVFATGVRIAPGANTLRGDFAINNSAANEQAISRLSASYLGSMYSDAQPSVDLVGLEASKSRLLDGLFDYVPLPIKFDRAPYGLLHKVTADIVVGGRITHWPSPSYHATLNLFFHNPLPSHARVESIYLEVFNGSAPLFHLRQDMDANKHVLPKFQNATLQLPLKIDDVAAPANVEELGGLAKAGAQQTQMLRINAKIQIIISPAHRQQVDFKHDAVPGMLCYSCEESAKRCGETLSDRVAGIV